MSADRRRLSKNSVSAPIQRRERYLYGNSRALREHQRREDYQLERHQRFERRRFDGRFNRGYGRGYGWGSRRRYGW